MRREKGASLRDRFRRWVPDRERLESSRWLRWAAPWLGHPALWRWSRRGVALGVALGVFFGLLVPLAQIPLSAAAAIVLRANLPVAAASTLITNPVTFVPLYYAAWRVGSWVTGDSAPPADPDMLSLRAADASWWERVAALGKPLLVGLSLMAGAAGAAAYGLVSLLWRWSVWRRQRARKGGRSAAAGVAEGRDEFPDRPGLERGAGDQAAAGKRHAEFDRQGLRGGEADDTDGDEQRGRDRCGEKQRR